MATTKGPATELHMRMLIDRNFTVNGMTRRSAQPYLNAILQNEMKGRIKLKKLDFELFPWAKYHFVMG